MLSRLLIAAASFGLLANAAEKYDGPRPPKPDVPYILQASRLIETEAAEAHQETKKGDITYTIDGVASPAKTPVAEPIFIIETQELSAERIELYRLDVRNGHRGVTMAQKRRRGGPKPIHLLVTRLSDHLYRVEADEHLDNGQYSLSPNDSNRVFCFEIY